MLKVRTPDVELIANLSKSATAFTIENVTVSALVTVALTSISVVAVLVFSRTVVDAALVNVGAPPPAAEAGSPPASTVANATDTETTMRRNGFSDFITLLRWYS